MIRGFYTARSGLAIQQTALDNSANNMANISTTGYKKQDLSFSELMYSDLTGQETNQPKNLKVGNGARIGGVNSLHTQGTITQTGNTLDFALASNGFFGVLTSNGEVKYTRDGSFRISNENGASYLVTDKGDYVLDRGENRIQIHLKDNLTNKIGVFDFKNPYALERAGDNLFNKTAESGEGYAIDGYIKDGCLELSNVDLSSEMTNLITAQRAYQFNAKVAQTADEIQSIINNLR